MSAESAKLTCLQETTGPIVPVVFATNDKFAPYAGLSPFLEEMIKAHLVSKADLERADAALRVGLAVTWLPRKVKGGIRCLRENGLAYTLRRGLFHLGLR